MCTKEEVREIVEQSADRTKKEIESYVNDLFIKRHNDINSTVSNQYKVIDERLKKIDSFVSKFEHLEPKELEEITRFKQGIKTAKNILVGFAILVGSIGAITTGFISLIKSVK